MQRRPKDNLAEFDEQLWRGSVRDAAAGRKEGKDKGSEKRQEQERRLTEVDIPLL